MKPALFLSAIQMLIVLMPLCAEDPLSRYFPAASLDKLRAGKTLEASIPSDYRLSLVPALATRDQIAAEVRSRQPTIGMEMARIIGGLPRQMDTKDGWLLLYNVLHAVSTMKGIQYYSVTRGNTQVLFTDSYVIDSAAAKNRVQDPVAGDIPPDDVIYTFQEDNTFGKNVYQESYSYRGDHILVKIENLTTIMFLFVPIIAARNLVSEVALIPDGNEVAFYGVSYLSTGLPLGDRHSREQSLKNRLEAMANWLAARLGGAAQ